MNLKQIVHITSGKHVNRDPPLCGRSWKAIADHDVAQLDNPPDMMLYPQERWCDDCYNKLSPIQQLNLVDL